jgi:anti-sigma regulatory factor (Ser/Thr protein kinase)
MAAVMRDDVTFWSTFLPGTVASVPAARHFAVEALHRLEGCAVDDDAIEGVAELLVSEIATNAVLHACSPMRLTVWCHDGHPRVEVRDDDPTFPREVVPSPLATGGRGMMLVETLAQSWGVNGNARGKTVWFEL